MGSDLGHLTQYRRLSRTMNVGAHMMTVAQILSFHANYSLKNIRADQLNAKDRYGKAEAQS